MGNWVMDLGAQPTLQSVASFFVFFVFGLGSHRLNPVTLDHKTLILGNYHF